MGEKMSLFFIFHREKEHFPWVKFSCMYTRQKSLMQMKEETKNEWVSSRRRERGIVVGSSLNYRRNIRFSPSRYFLAKRNLGVTFLMEWNEMGYAIKNVILPYYTGTLFLARPRCTYINYILCGRDKASEYMYTLIRNRHTHTYIVMYESCML